MGVASDADGDVKMEDASMAEAGNATASTARPRLGSKASSVGASDVRKKISIVEKSTVSPSSKTFSIYKEDHTLGNALRHVLMMDTENVELCGYAVPHPMESIMTLRLQTKNGQVAETVLRSGIDALKEICSHVDGAFDSALHDFKNAA